VGNEKKLKGEKDNHLFRIYPDFYERKKEVF